MTQTTAASANHPGLAPALAAPVQRLALPTGPSLAYYAAPEQGGRPLVLIHSINAAPSSFEVKPLFEHYRPSRAVYSLELPGFGQAGRGRAPYSPQLYAEAINRFLSQVLDQPADLLTLSLSGEFAVRATLKQPEQVRSLVLISPTGFSRRQPPPQILSRVLHPLMAMPPWSQSLFELLTSKRSIQYYLGQSFMGSAPAETLDYAYATAHQPGARHAPFTFLSGQLFTPRPMTTLYDRLNSHPVCVLADRDPYVRFDMLDEFIAGRANWQRARVVPNMGLPHWEDLAATAKSLDAFWQSLDAA